MKGAKTLRKQLVAHLLWAVRGPLEQEGKSNLEHAFWPREAVLAWSMPFARHPRVNLEQEGAKRNLERTC